MSIDIKRLKDEVDSSLTKARMAKSMSKYCVEKDSSESNKECFKIDTDNLILMEEIETLVNQLCEYPD